MKNKIKLVILAMVSMLVVTGCSAKSPSKVVEDYFKEIKKGELAELSDYVLKDDSQEESETEAEKEESKDDPIMDEAMNLYFSSIDVKVLSENIEEEKAIVEVEFTGYNLSNILLEVLQENFASLFSEEQMTDEEVSKMYLDKIQNGKIETRKGKLNLTKVEKEWKLVVDEDYSTLIMGSAELENEKSK